MDSDIEFLEHIFDRMKEANLVETKADYSQGLLGKGPSYLTSMRARERVVPMEVLDHMSLQLMDRAKLANAAVADTEAALCLAMATSHREAEIRNEFEEHRRRRLAAELSDVDAGEASDDPAATPGRFVQIILRKVGLMKRVMLLPTSKHGGTLH